MADLAEVAGNLKGSLYYARERSRTTPEVWILSFFCLIWSVWLHRNEVIFKDFKPDRRQLFDLFSLRLGWWCKAKWPNMGSSVTDLSSNLHNLSYIRNRSIEVNQKSWISPRTGQLKFNMDGVVRGSFGDASIAV
ncbi:hypothetical protein V6N11_080100 [Hibiscus sabdariffa]|uniref:Uncharacterized protein n=1 Tax=Hibiscus sabdariffa TaxID=183260 RepID=A0ABR2RXP5_9ROSI